MHNFNINSMADKGWFFNNLNNLLNVYYKFILDS